MQLSIATKPPFSFAQALAFVRRFPPCQGEYVVTEDSLTAAVSVHGIARGFTLRPGLCDDAPLRIDLPRHIDGPTQWALLARAADLVGAGDDVTALYAAAAGDPAFQMVV